MASYNRGRRGLLLLSDAPSGVREYHGQADVNQARELLDAWARLAAGRFGGPGLYHGGARAVGDLAAAGTEYPAFEALIADAAGVLWPVGSDAASPIGDLGTGGAGELYVRPALLTPTPGSGAAAKGGFGDYEIGVADSAPANSLKLADVTVSGGAITALTPVAAPTPRRPVGKGLTAPSGSAGATWLDAAGGLWQYLGAWRQVRPAVIAPGDVTALEALAPPDGYLLRVVGERAWQWDTTHDRWLGDRVWFPWSRETGANRAASGGAAWQHLPTHVDLLVERVVHGIAQAAGTWDASNRWEIQWSHRVETAAAGGAVTVATVVVDSYVANARRVEAVSGVIIPSSGGRMGHLQYVKVAGPANLTTYYDLCVARVVRPL